jgi:uncharacterized protein YyaL (SSP411 family)
VRSGLSIEDADSEGEEGKFYIWSQDAFERIAADGSTGIPWSRIFNLEPEGNFHDEATGRKTGKNILYMTRTWSQWGDALDEASSSIDRQWESLRQALFSQRQQRIPPLKDDKILTDWNGLMIAALALGARVLGQEDYAAAARSAVESIDMHLVDEQGRLFHRFRGGQAAVEAQAGDYMFLIYSSWGGLPAIRDGTNGPIS